VTRPFDRSSGEKGLTLVELLVGLVIMGLISTTLVTIYLGLGESFSYSTKSTNAREKARQAVARLGREIRDAQSNTGNTEASVVRARERWILLSTTFNKVGNDDPNLAPRLVMYRLYQDGRLFRFEDLSGNGTIAGVNIDPSPTDATTFNLTEQQNGEGARLIASNVVNYDSSTPSQKKLFLYSYVDDQGIMPSPTPYVYGTNNRARILTVQLHLLIDLNPGHSPVYTDLQTSAQLRNQRTN
jgi:prepilin-type N-terminal cleavage/methylation domain-containing protein